MLSDEDEKVGQSNGTAVAGSNGAVVAASTANPSVVANGKHRQIPATNGSSNGKTDVASASRKPSTYLGHNREEVTRLLIQALSDMGYESAAQSVSRDSSFDLESSTVAAFRSAVLAGSWLEAEQLLVGTTTPGRSEVPGLALAPGSDRTVMRFWLRQQKFLELLEQRETGRALTVLRKELTPLYHDTAKLHFLSSLLMCQSAEDLKAKADWDGALGESRTHLLSQLSRCISPAVMLPENRLAILLHQVKQNQINTCLYHTAASSPSLYSDHHCERRHFPTEAALTLDISAEVWQVQFSHDGSRLAACGKSATVTIWETKSFQIVQTLEEHDQGVGNISWSPDDSMIVACSLDKYARIWDVKTGTVLKRLRRFEEPVSGCVWGPDSRSFVLGTLDRTHPICTFHVYDDETLEWGKKHRVQDICGSPDGRWLVAVDDSNHIHVYNAVTRELEYDIDSKARPTSVSISQDSRHLLVNKTDGEAQLIDLVTKNSVQKFLGHTGGEFVIRSSFGGANESFVTSGSEDGNILIWHKNIGAAVERLHGHEPRCNAVSWNPADPCMLASCGDDGRVKIWTNKAKAFELKSRHPRPYNGWRNPNNDA